MRKSSTLNTQRTKLVESKILQEDEFSMIQEEDDQCYEAQKDYGNS